jgi:hypothetical protein
VPISFRCSCGNAVNVPEVMAGGRTKCPACAATLTVPDPHVPAPAPASKKPRKVREPREDGGGGFRIALSPAVSGGLVTMLIAGGWIAFALTRDRIPIYAPIMFVFGLVAVVRGLFGAPED